MPMMKFKKFKPLYLVIFFLAVSLTFAYTNCAPPSHDEVVTEKIGNYPSPFEKDKILLATPKYKTVRTKTSAKFVTFDAEKDKIPSSAMVLLSCAAIECANVSGSRDDLGRLSCYGYNQAVKRKWPMQVNRYSFGFEFGKGETLEEIRTKFDVDPIDQKCIVGISNYGEVRLSDDRVNDPDVSLSNTNYNASPYLEQINFSEQMGFIYSLKSALQKTRVGVIDGDFMNYYPDLDFASFDYNLRQYEKNFKIDGAIINVGGAPLPTSCASSCHGSWVSQLIAGTNGNNTMGAGIAAGSAANYSDTKITAANVYSIDSNSGAKRITLDDVNNAIALMAFLKVDVINMSLAYEGIPDAPPFTLLTAILSAIGQGSVVVVSAGNNSVNLTTKKNADGTNADTLSYPSAWGVGYLGLISVAAMNRSYTNLAYFTNYGSDNIDIAAPGEQLMIGGKSMSGTSFSAPLVSGAVAITKAYYRSQLGDQAEISPAQIEMALLAGSKTLSSISSFVKDGLALDLTVLKTQVTTNALPLVPSAKLDTDGFWYTRDGSSMTYGIRTVTANLPENDGSLFLGIWEKMEMGLPPLAEFKASNGVNNFELPFHKFLVGDDGFWVVLYRIAADGTRVPISSRLYKFTSLITQPSVDNAVLVGAINQINTDVSGWACLVGRAERLTIEVRTGNKNGPKIVSQVVGHQPKGRDYFDKCTPFTVMLGFHFDIKFFQKDTPYYFVAIHPSDPNKNVYLNDEPFIIEENERAAPAVHSLKKTIDSEKVTLSGKVCWVDQKAPGIISNYFDQMMEDSSTVINPLVKSWLENIISKKSSALWNAYNETVTTITPNKTYVTIGRFKISTTIFGLHHNAWSTTEPIPVTSPPFIKTASIMNFDKINSMQSIPFKDALVYTGGYGIIPIIHVNDPDGKMHNESSPPYQELKPFFIDHWQEPAMSDVPNQPLPGPGWGRAPFQPVNYHTEVKPEIYKQSVGNHARAAWDSPVASVFGSTLEVADSNDACSALQQNGIGQSFKITRTRASLMNEFNLGIDLFNDLYEGNFKDLYTQTQLDDFFKTLNDAYKAEVLASGQQLGKSVIDQGELMMHLRFMSVTSGQTYKEFYLKDIPNQ